MSRKSKKRAAKRAAEAIPEEILAEGSGPHADQVVDADAQSLADAAADALASAEIGTVEAEVEAAAMAAEAAVTAGEAERARSADRPKKKRGRKAAPAAEPEVALDPWGQPIVIEAAPDEPAEEPADAEVASDADPEAVGPDDELAAVASDDEPAAEAVASDDDAWIAAHDASDAEGADDGDDADDADAADADDADAPDASELSADPGELAPDESGEAGELVVASDEEAVEGAVLPTSAATMDAAQLKHLVEALIFAADRPVTLQRLRQLTRVSDVRRIEQSLAELAEDYKARGIALQVVSGGYQFRTNTQYSGWVQQLIAGRPVRLSRAQLETLAIIAYRQPITRPEIDEIRGVDSSSTLKVLLDRALIRILGKREEAGRPTLYGTTKEFLDFFSLGDLRELPTLREYSELTAESRKVVSDRLGVGLDGEPTAPPETPAEASSETPAEASSEPSSEAAVEASSEVPVEASSEVPVEASSEVPVEASSEVPVEALSADPEAELDAADADANEPAENSATGDVDDGGEVNLDGSSELSADSHVEAAAAIGEPDESIEAPAVPHVGDSAESIEAFADSHVGDSPESVDTAAVPHAGDSAEPIEQPAVHMGEHDLDGASELSAASDADHAAAVDEPTGQRADASQLSPSDDDSSEPALPNSGDSDESVEARTVPDSEDSDESVEARTVPDSEDSDESVEARTVPHVEDSDEMNELSAVPHVGDSEDSLEHPVATDPMSASEPDGSKLSGHSYVENAAAVDEPNQFEASEVPHVGDSDNPLDPEHIAARVIAGESDRMESADDAHDMHADVEAASADDPGAAHAHGAHVSDTSSDSDASDASAPDDPAVD